MRVTFDPGVGRKSSINRVIRWVGGAGVTGFMTGAILSTCGSTGDIASVFCSAESGSSVGSVLSVAMMNLYYLSPKRAVQKMVGFQEAVSLLEPHHECYETAQLMGTITKRPYTTNKANT